MAIEAGLDERRARLLQESSEKRGAQGVGGQGGRDEREEREEWCVRALFGEHT